VGDEVAGTGADVGAWVGRAQGSYVGSLVTGAFEIDGLTVGNFEVGTFVGAGEGFLVGVGLVVGFDVTGEFVG